MLLQRIRMQQKVQVRSIHVQIAYDGIAGQMSKCCRQRRFAGAPLTADDQYFRHKAPLDGLYGHFQKWFQNPLAGPISVLEHAIHYSKYSMYSSV